MARDKVLVKEISITYNEKQRRHLSPMKPGRRGYFGQKGKTLACGPMVSPWSKFCATHCPAVLPTLRREREAPRRTVLPTEVGEGDLSLWDPGGKANQEPTTP